MNTEQHIQDYLLNRMKADERKDFERLLKKNKDFQKNFNEHKAVFEAFKISEANRLKSILAAQEKRISLKRRFISKPIIYVIAATFIVLLGSSVYFNFFKQDLYAKYYETFPNVYQPIVRGDSDERLKAFMYYENYKFLEAQHEFESILNNEENANIRFYLGLSYLNNNQFKEAITEFEKINDKNFEFNAETLWYNALAEIKLENKTKAKKLLLRLSDKYPKYKTTDIAEILDSL